MALLRREMLMGKSLFKRRITHRSLAALTGRCIGALGTGATLLLNMS